MQLIQEVINDTNITYTSSKTSNSCQWLEQKVEKQRYERDQLHVEVRSNKRYFMIEDRPPAVKNTCSSKTKTNKVCRLEHNIQRTRCIAMRRSNINNF